MEFPKTNRKHHKSKSSTSKKIIFAVAFVLATLTVGIGILSFTDIAGDRVLAIAADAVKEQTGLLLSAENVRGNPVRGYTFIGVSLDRDEEERQNILAAGSLNARINFASLLRGSPRLSLLAVGGVNMDLDRFIDEISAIDFPETDAEAGGEIPIDRISLVNSRFTSVWGSVDVNAIGASINGTSMVVDVSAAVNGVPVTGNFGADFQEQAILVQNMGLQVGRGRMTVAGSIDPSIDGAVGLDIQGNLRGMDVSELVAFWQDLSPRDYVGNIDLDFTIEGSSKDISITADLDFRGTRIAGYPLDSFTSRLRFADMRISAENARATTLGIPIEGELAMAIRDDAVPSIMIQLEGSGVPLSEVAQLHPGLGAVGGYIERFSINIHGPTNALGGVIELSAPNIAIMGKQINNLAAQTRFTRDGAATLSSRFVLEGAQAYAQGTISGITALTDAELNLTANLVDLDIRRIESLIPDGESHGLSGLITANLAVRGTVDAPVIDGTLSSPRFTAEGYTLDNPSLSFAFERDTLTLRESSGSWDGLPIRVSGTVGPVSSPTPNVSLTAQLSFSPETLRAFVPDIDQYELRGTINAGVSITGRLPQPDIELMASSQALSAFGMLEARNLEVTTALTGDLSTLDRIDLAFSAASASAAGVGLQDLSATVRKDGQLVRLENVSARSGDGSVTGGGTVTLTDGADAQLNLALDMRQLDLAPLAQSGGLGAALSGLLSGRLEVTGMSSNPGISFNGQSPRVTVEGMMLTDLTADISGNAAALRINDFRGNVGGAPLSATGSISLSEPFRADIDIAGNGLDLAALTQGMPDLQGQVSGRADLRFNLRATADGNSGSGSINSPAVTVFGIRGSEVAIPLSLAGDTFRSEGGALNLYGGRVTNTFVLNMNNMGFTNEINVSGVDVNALIQDATGGLDGRITGRGDLSARITGNMGETLEYSGSGQFTMGEGSITGFTGLGLLNTLYGVDGIRYTQISAPLRLETGRLYIARGTSMTPPANDPIYRSAVLIEDGVVTLDQRLYFVMEASVNFQLINALAGGVVGGIEALLGGGSVQNILSSGNLESALRGALGRGREQGREADFRDVTARATGTFDSPSVSLIRIGQGQQATGYEAPAAAETPAPVDIIRDRVIDAIIPSRPEQPAQEQGEAQQEQPQARPEDVIRERIIDAITPSRPEQPAQEQEEQEAQQEQPRQIEQRIEDELRRGIDSLRRRR